MSSNKKYKVEIDKERCKGCGLCVTFCKKNVLEISKDRETNKNGYIFAKVVNIENCTGCANCGIICPEGTCIEIKKY